LRSTRIYVCYLFALLDCPAGLCFTADLFKKNFFIYFAARSPGSLGRSPWNFATWLEVGRVL